MDNRGRRLRQCIQTVVAFTFFVIIIIYSLYLKEILSFKVLSIADLNPYGAWSALKDWVTDSSFEFDGMTKSIALTIAILSLSVLGGRFLCGWLCPLGALQDLSNYIFNTLFKGKTHAKHNQQLASSAAYDKKPGPLQWTRLVPSSFLVLTTLLLLSIMGYGAKLAELSPWRALLNLPRIFSAWREMKSGFWILFAIILISSFIPRFFCRFLCPLGAIQTLFSSLSFVRIKKNKECISCNLCLGDCPMDIKLVEKEDSLSPECIRCMNCIDSCAISQGKSLTLKSGNKIIKPKVYASIMVTAFFVIWLGLPKLWTNGVLTSNISLAGLKDGTYHGDAKGFAARIITEIKIIDGRIINIEVIDHHESKGWYDEVFLKLPKEIIKKQRLDVDAISGATKTSKGLIRSIESALKKATN